MHDDGIDIPEDSIQEDVFVRTSILISRLMADRAKLLQGYNKLIDALLVPGNISKDELMGIIKSYISLPKY